MYRVLLERAAERDLRRLPEAIQTRMISALQSLGNNPRPAGCRKLVGTKSYWRIRVGDYRAIYELDDASRIVRVERVRHRREAYR